MYTCELSNPKTVSSMEKPAKICKNKFNLNENWNLNVMLKITSLD